MAVIDREFLRRLPKAELHCHLDGSVRPATMIELGREHRVPMPSSDPDGLREFMLVSDARRLEDYLTRFETTLAVMQSAESIERIAYELAEDAALDGVRYIEVRFAPILNTRAGLTRAGAVEAAVRGLGRAEREHGIIGRVIVTALRTQPPEVSLKIAHLTVDFRSSGVVAFDLAGAEAGNPAALHAEAFRHVLAHDMGCTCHAGEGDGPESVRQAVHACGAHRLGHATSLINDPSLTQYVNDRRIALEICLTSNVQTHAVESYAAHPLRAYYDQDLNVVLNTDNRLMSGTTLTDEYHHAATHLDFTFDELCDIALNGFESSFLPWQERIVLLDEIAQELEELRAEVAET